MLVLLACAANVGAQPASDPTPLAYRSAAEEARFHALTAELRCVQCQNQSLADSHAQIALDLRREVLQLMQQGQSDAQIKRFLVDRYGEFVLYRPQVESRTWLLWFGPLALLGGGALLLAWVVRRRAPAGAAPLAQDEQEW
ncbi:cytochrome c-type biogenesis protein CcmH [Xanthomonas sp. AM6]|uniref:cytochrome c-type biogenesis protein n=1 Tax=Xanthomonas sp. AM6 TaxID=2982531 RepID=UPI0021DAB49F|nr:cytochrome c-type biogenesis protein [Xanthomonas sp. AM6]UYB54430.1 cytochrome c-type biogenesis protein CcmH [Xanthomonas sp. AM6]